MKADEFCFVPRILSITLYHNTCGYQALQNGEWLAGAGLTLDTVL